MSAVILKIWRGGEVYVSTAMNADGGALSWTNVDQVKVDRVTIHSDAWPGEWTEHGSVMRQWNPPDEA